MLKAIIFDWGDTVMRDFRLSGPMTGWERVEAVPGIEQALAKLHPSYQCYIATTAAHSGAEEMKRSLARVHLDGYFNGFFSSKDLGAAKPDPAFYLEILKITGYQPPEALAIGNLYEKDVVSAKRAGLITIFFNENDVPGNFPMADAVINEMVELPAAISDTLAY
jgi:putative hydrolase of the HAD superfamily